MYIYVCTFSPYSDITKVAVNTVDIAQVTHADPRCSASCVAVTTAVSVYLAGMSSI